MYVWRRSRLIPARALEHGPEPVSSAVRGRYRAQPVTKIGNIARVCLFVEEQPAVSIHHIHESEQKSFANEREILYQVLFDMKKDITDLKQVVKHMMEDSETHPSSIITSDNTRVSVPVKYEAVPKKITLDESGTNNIPETAEYEESALSISDVEKEMILKALERHNGKRKLAANDLGISERTLYRKIKEYSILD